MSVKNKNNNASLKRELWSEIQEITVLHKQTAEHTVKLLKDSKDFLEFKRKKGLGEDFYLKRLKILINMGIIYYYGLYEGFTRFFFRKVAVYDLDIPEDQFKNSFPRLHDIIKLMKARYKIYLDGEIFNVIMNLKEARHNIAHGVGNAKPEFEIILVCHQKILQYFDFIEYKMARNLNLI